MRNRSLAATAAVAATALTAAIANIATATPAAATETFSIMTTNVPTATVIATGGFTAGGTVDAEGKSQKGGKGQKVRFPDGTFVILIHGSGDKHQQFDTATCLYTKSGTGAYTLADGTGAYKGISGSGRVSFTLRQVLARVKGVCAQPNTDVTALEFTETARGPASFRRDQQETI